MNDFKLKPMKNATNIAFSSTPLGANSLFEYPSQFLWSFPQIFAVSNLFSWVYLEISLFLHQIPLGFVIQQVQVAPISHSIFLNHKNSII